MNRGLRCSRSDRTDDRSSKSSSKAGERGLVGLSGVFKARRSGAELELNDMLLVLECECRLGLPGESLNKPSRYAGRVPHVDGRGNAMVISAFQEYSVCDPAMSSVRSNAKGAKTAD